MKFYRCNTAKPLLDATIVVFSNNFTHLKKGKFVVTMVLKSSCLLSGGGLFFRTAFSFAHSRLPVRGGGYSGGQSGAGP